MEPQQINDIIEKYKQGIASPAELEQLNNWYHDNAYLDAEYPDSEQQVYDRVAARLKSNINPVQRRTRLWPRIAAAAAILLVACAGLFYYTSRHLEGSEATRDLLNYANDITPGKNTATITLANGSTIVLSDAKTGVVVGAESLTYNDGSAVDANEERNLLNSTDKRSLPYGRDDGLGGDNVNGQVEGSMRDDGKGQYDGNAGKDGRSRDNAKGVDDSGGSRNNARSGLLTTTTPRGGTYQITLPDGTKVWLNAASSLSFPSTFQGLGNRKVELSGEAYFEVAKDKAHPFIVATDKQEVEVLGTHFNINSYADEPNTKTTLLEGSVHVSLLSVPGSGVAGDRVVLKPGEQSILSGSNRLAVKQVDVSEAIAWKNGRFAYNKANLEEVMRQVSRWYDIEVIYRSAELKQMRFSGALNRYENLSGILNAIAFSSGLSFEVQGHKVTMYKKDKSN